MKPPSQWGCGTRYINIYGLNILKEDYISSQNKVAKCFPLQLARGSALRKEWGSIVFTEKVSMNGNVAHL